jgi:hypothetical protein
MGESTGSINSPTPDNDESCDLIYFDCLPRTLSLEPGTLPPSAPDILSSNRSCVVTLNDIPTRSPKSQVLTVSTSTYTALALAETQGKRLQVCWLIHSGKVLSRLHFK